MLRVALKYCGSCNPQVRLGEIVNHLAHRSDDFTVVPLTEGNIDVVVILCGCPRACGEKEEVKKRARQCLVVAGESLSGEPVMEADLAAAVAERLLRLGRRFD